MLSCRKASELIEKKLLVGLSRKEKVQLFLHTSMCEYCTRYEKQSRKLNEILKTSFQNADTIDVLSLKTDLQHLKDKIHSEIH